MLFAAMVGYSSYVFGFVSLYNEAMEKLCGQAKFCIFIAFRLIHSVENGISLELAYTAFNTAGVNTIFSLSQALDFLQNAVHLAVPSILKRFLGYLIKIKLPKGRFD